MAAARSLALAAALVLWLVPSAAGAEQHASLPQIERQVMCVTCKIPLNVAESPQADRERAYIRSLIESGQDEAQIKRALVSQYGASVLGLPADHGFGVAAYLVPLAAVLGAGGAAGGAAPALAKALACGACAALRRRRFRPPTPRASSPTSRASTELHPVRRRHAQQLQGAGDRGHRGDAQRDAAGLERRRLGADARGSRGRRR